MLVLSRKVDQSIMVGDDVTLTVVAIRRDVVSIGVEAPLDLPIYRQEFWEKLNRDRRDQEEKGG